MAAARVDTATQPAAPTAPAPGRPSLSLPDRDGDAHVAARGHRMMEP